MRQTTLDRFLAPLEAPRCPSLIRAVNASRIEGSKASAAIVYTKTLRAGLFSTLLFTPLPSSTCLSPSLVRYDPDGRVLLSLNLDPPGDFRLSLRGVVILQSHISPRHPYFTAQWNHDTTWGTIALGYTKGVVTYNFDTESVLGEIGIHQFGPRVGTNVHISDVVWAGPSTALMSLQSGQWALWDLRAPSSCSLQNQAVDSTKSVHGADFARRLNINAESRLIGMAVSGPLVHLSNEAGHIHTWDLRRPVALASSMSVPAVLTADRPTPSEIMQVIGMCASTLRTDSVIVRTTRGLLLECCLATKRVLSAWEHPPPLMCPPHLWYHREVSKDMYSVEGGVIVADDKNCRIVYYDARGLVYHCPLPSGMGEHNVLTSLHVTANSFPGVAVSDESGGVYVTSLWESGIMKEGSPENPA